MRYTLIVLLLLCAASTTARAAPIHLSWRDNSNNEDGFLVERGVDGSVFLKIGQTPENVSIYTDETAVAGKLYYYRVSAYNEYGSSGYSNVAMGKVIPIPATPDGLEALFRHPDGRVWRVELGDDDQPVLVPVPTSTPPAE